MPIDFERIPPRADVPSVSQPSVIGWIALLVVLLCIGATVTLLCWSDGGPTSSAWFWLCAVGFPVLGWAFLLVAKRAYGHIVRQSVLAQNRVSEQAEQACHDAASEPLSIYGYGWRFSSEKEENSLQSLINGTVQSGLRPSAAFPGRDVHARWIDVPDEPFYPGNELGEHTRHLAVCEWLMTSLLNDLSKSLAALPTQTSLHVHVCVHSRLKTELVVEQLRCALKDRPAPADFQIHSEPDLSIFAADEWLDRLDSTTAHLVVSIQLREAISTMLDGGLAEAGVALLLGHPRLFKEAAHTLRLHRPSVGIKKVNDVIGLATRWGQTEVKALNTAWIHGLSIDDLGSARRLATFDEAMPCRQIEASVGECSKTGGWLAVALATANAELSSLPQLILSARGDELIAMVCRKEA